MLDRLSDAAPIEAAGAGYLLHVFWKARGAVAEEHERLRGLLARDGLRHQSRAALLVRLSDVEMHLGRVEAAEATAREALALAEPGTEPHWLAVAELAFHALHRGDTEEAVRLGRQALEEAETARRRVARPGDRQPRHHPHGRQPHRGGPIGLERCVREARRSGLASLETIGLADLGWLDLLEHDYESSRAAYAAALTQLRSRARQVLRARDAEGTWARVARLGAA